jgi:hypothetical protein
MNCQERNKPVYRRLRLHDTEIRILPRLTRGEKMSKERMHRGIEADDVDADVPPA